MTDTKHLFDSSAIFKPKLCLMNERLSLITKVWSPDGSSNDSEWTTIDGKTELSWSRVQGWCQSMHSWQSNDKWDGGGRRASAGTSSDRFAIVL